MIFITKKSIFERSEWSFSEKSVQSECFSTETGEKLGYFGILTDSKGTELFKTRNKKIFDFIKKQIGFSPKCIDLSNFVEEV